MEEFVSAPRVKKARGRMTKLVTTAWWLGGNIVWTVLTGSIVLVAPVFIEYERECQMFEQLAQTQSLQMNAPPMD
eukprot:CAMPEP_0168387656 /NCGR_PEP_ID=MMETSP0228-20121227/16056_1 /TAXON_ID=133427 /ORGANISM="Protoceratium reticulatum, Strain CCCM 535 (=CCMP 1889)" /LENGTH=74 /DNA_ID=CAMNT_0008400895 /DNA_START=28 /DNA_END=252 /DNA_ORIENTATION=+